jgi:hypothetical protein
MVDESFAAAIAFFVLVFTTSCLALDGNMAPQKRMQCRIESSPLPLLQSTVIDREAVVWLHYSVLVYISIGAFLTHSDEFFLFLFGGMLVGLMLDHPVLQMVGCIGATWCISWVLLSVIFGDIIRSGEAIFPFLVGCGMVTTGNTLKRYRPLLRYYCRRMWKRLVAALLPDAASGSDTGLSSRTQENEDNEIPRRLMESFLP